MSKEQDKVRNEHLECIAALEEKYFKGDHSPEITNQLCRYYVQLRVCDDFMGY